MSSLYFRYFKQYSECYWKRRCNGTYFVKCQSGNMSLYNIFVIILPHLVASFLSTTKMWSVIIIKVLKVLKIQDIKHTHVTKSNFFSFISLSIIFIQFYTNLARNFAETFNFACNMFIYTISLVLRDNDTDFKKKRQLHIAFCIRCFKERVIDRYIIETLDACVRNM